MTTPRDASKSLAADHQPLRVLSYGGGTQSTALALMSIEGELDPLDAIVFADTHHEMPETYRYVELIAELSANAGIPFIRASAGDLKQTLFDRQGRGMQPNLPVRVRTANGSLQRMNAYRCSYDHKRRVIERELKRLCGPRGAWKRGRVEQWIGFSVEEIGRVKPADQCRCGHNRIRTLTRAERGRRGDDDVRVELIHTRESGCARCDCDSFDPWQSNRWPLIEQQLTRTQTLRWIAEHGYPEPARSACYFCPNRGNTHWRQLYAARDHCAHCGAHRREHPCSPPSVACAGFLSLWDSAVEVDEFVRHGMNEMRGTGYLHQSGIPLTDADLRPRYEQLRDRGIEPLFVDETDTDCQAGVCFT